jgi:hypothetical protein
MSKPTPDEKPGKVTLSYFDNAAVTSGCFFAVSTTP